MLLLYFWLCFPIPGSVFQDPLTVLALLHIPLKAAPNGRIFTLLLLAVRWGCILPQCFLFRPEDGTTPSSF